LDLRAWMHSHVISHVVTWKCNCLDWSACHPCAVAMQLCFTGGAETENFHR
jgi:hypothetical protein